MVLSNLFSVIPAKAGIHMRCRYGDAAGFVLMDPRFRGDDGG
jgi:hypothetical protein